MQMPPPLRLCQSPPSWQCDTPSTAITVCAVLSMAFVGCLYLLPPSIRRLHRNHPRHIRARSLLTTLVALSSARLLLPCAVWSSQWKDLSYQLVVASWFLLHAMVLYLGVFVKHSVAIWDHLRRQDALSLTQFVRALYVNFIGPTLFECRRFETRWLVWRWMIYAPFTEEVVFRLVTGNVLVSSGLSIGRTCVLAPLFFGLAHVHHGLVLYQSGAATLPVVCVSVLFQFLYTTLFGMYVSWILLRHHGVVAIVLLHVFCNAMGLPDFTSYWRQSSTLHPYRWALSGTLITGMVGFGVGLWYPPIFSRQMN